jgi:hypothetical protein
MEVMMAVRNESHLIIVPGHGVCKKDYTGPTVAPRDSSWVGIFPGEGPFYIAHAEQGVRLAVNDLTALLVFSGGQTREDAGRRSEAESYWEIASQSREWNWPAVQDRAFREDYARDSLENLLFAIAVFKQETGGWPTMITVCGWKFKEKRYSLHRQAIKWPKQKFVYIGVNDPAGDALAKAQAGEKAKVESVTRDLFLVGSEWVAQREQRDPFHRCHPYRGVDRDLDAFFDFLDRNTFTGRLPWV